MGGSGSSSECRSELGTDKEITGDTAEVEINNSNKEIEFS